ncbi:MAG: hypothetical protein RIF41_28565, partial [Polyangiaceae bacterium]
VRNERPEQFGRTTDKSWSPGASGPPTRPADHGAPDAIFDGPTSGGDDDANVTQRRFAIRDRHGTMPMDQVLVPSEQPPTPPPPATAHPATPQVMPPPLPGGPVAPSPPADLLPNPLQPSRLQAPSVTTLASETDPPPEPNWTPPPAFSERPPWEDAPPAPKSRGPWIAFAVVGALILAGGAFALGWVIKPSAPDRAPADAAPPTPTSSDAPAPDEQATAEPASSGNEAAPATSTKPSAEPADPAEPTKADLAELLSYEGYLTVTSSADAEVYVQGMHVGPTNKRLVSKCYQRFVRLKKGTNGEWITPGRPVRIACMSSTTVEINPD